MRKSGHRISYGGKWIHYHWITDPERNLIACPEDHKWRLDTTFMYHSDRYNEDIWCTAGETSDGATGAFDIESIGWWVHDIICQFGVWHSGRRIVNFEASTVLFDILRSEGRSVRDFWWFLTTFLGGGGEARVNGMFTLNLVTDSEEDNS
jgi:hypothetical protein